MIERATEAIISKAAEYGVFSKTCLDLGLTVFDATVLARAALDSQWLDISEAPRDGTPVDLWWVSDDGNGGCRLTDFRWRAAGHWIDESGTVILDYQLTHFRYPPGPPA